MIETNVPSYDLPNTYDLLNTSRKSNSWYIFTFIFETILFLILSFVLVFVIHQIYKHYFSATNLQKDKFKTQLASDLEEYTREKLKANNNDSNNNDSNNK